jgi:hypothetical protein
VQSRRASLDAVSEAAATGGSASRLLALLEWEQSDDAARVLAVRVHLARNEDDQALALVDRLLAQIRSGEALGLSVQAAEPTEEASAEAEDAEAEPEPVAWPAGGAGLRARPTTQPRGADSLVMRLRVWLRPFQDARKAGPVEERFRGLLQQRRDEGAVSTQAWRLAFELAPAPDRAALAAALEEAWFRGEVPPEALGLVLDTLASLLPGEAVRWFSRWPSDLSYNATAQRASLMARLKDQAGAARLLAETRLRALWPIQDEVAAFDGWRRLKAPATPGEPAPEAWVAALPFWTAPADGVTAGLGAHLKLHPFDILASRAAFRSAAPAEAEDLLRVSMTLDSPALARRRSADQLFLGLRAARGYLPRSWRAARAALGPIDVRAFAGDLVARRFPAATVNAALADVARIAARSGDDTRLASVLAVLGTRQASNAAALRAELVADLGPGVGAIEALGQQLRHPGDGGRHARS